MRVGRADQSQAFSDLAAAMRRRKGPIPDLGQTRGESEGHSHTPGLRRCASKFLDAQRRKEMLDEMRLVIYHALIKFG